MQKAVMAEMSQRLTQAMAAMDPEDHAEDVAAGLDPGLGADAEGVLEQMDPSKWPPRAATAQVTCD
jgi:hypothetical protein